MMASGCFTDRGANAVETRSFDALGDSLALARQQLCSPEAEEVAAGAALSAIGVAGRELTPVQAWMLSVGSRGS